MESVFQKKSVFDWLTVLAAWAGIAIASWTAYVQYTASLVHPAVTFGHWGAKYKTIGIAGQTVVFRALCSNSGSAPAKDVRVKIWDVPKSAEVFCSLDSEILNRTEDTVLLKIRVIPPKTNCFVNIRPFTEGSERFTPYIPDVYYDEERVKREDCCQQKARLEVLELLAKVKDLESAVAGSHRRWEEPVPEDDIELGSHFFTIHDR